MIKVAFVKDNGEVAYTASPAVDEMYIDGQKYNGNTAIHIDVLANDKDVIETWYYQNGSWHEREYNQNGLYVWEDYAWVFNREAFNANLRDERNRLLFGTDWTQALDSPLSDNKKAQFAEYRQALRDFPAQYSTETDLNNVAYPTPPEA